MSPNNKAYDVFVYHDFASSELPEMGKPFPGFPEDLRVIAVGRGVHGEERTTVVLGFGPSPAPEIQRLFSGE